MKTIQSFLYISIIVLFASCKKNPGDINLPAVTLTSPAASQVYANGSSVNITGTVTDNGLHELKISIINAATTAVLFTKTVSVHGLNGYTVNENWINNVSAITNATVKVEVTDLGNNYVEKTVQIVLNP